jgi:hypothetical protein
MSEAAPLPGGSLPVHEWDEALTALDTCDPDARAGDAQALLDRLDAALADL